MSFTRAVRVGLNRGRNVSQLPASWRLWPQASPQDLSGRKLSFQSDS